MLAETRIPLAGKRAIVIGRSNLVGKPVSLMLLEQSCTVTMAHSKTEALDERVRESDIVIAAVGVAGLVRGDWIKPGAVVIDVGMNRREDKKLVGDVEFDAARERAAWITPVPGGVGLMTVAMLMQNTVDAAERKLT
jgi:methylenetetrahydrofolate dehydrogenase (NADP+)/methenyltetrahydrofolate cyclohydrolase